MRTSKGSRRSTFGKQLRQIIEDYRKEHGVDEWTMDAVAEWAIERGRYQRQPISAFQQCKRELARAAQQSLYTDPQGREVRRLHPVKLSGEGGPPVVIWADLTNAKPKHIHLSLQQGRQAIAADVFRHKDVGDSYNDNNPYQAKLPLSDYNFNLDVEERGQPGEYPDRKPPEE